MHAVDRDRTRNLAARAGRWSAEHRKLAIWGWLGLRVRGVCSWQRCDGGGAGELARARVGESGPGVGGDGQVLPAATPTPRKCLPALTPRYPPPRPRSRAVAADVQRRLAAVPYSKAFESPYAAGNQARISADGHSALLRFQLAGKEDNLKNASPRR